MQCTGRGVALNKCAVAEKGWEALIQVMLIVSTNLLNNHHHRQ